MASRAATRLTAFQRSLAAASPRSSLARSLTTAARTGSTSTSTSMMASSRNSSAIAIRRLHATAQQLKPAAAATASTTSAASTATSFPQSHERIASPIDTTNFIDNEFTASRAETWIDLFDPATNNLVTRVPQSTEEEMKAAVASAQAAFPAWKATSIMAKQQIMFKFVNLIRANWDRLAASITLEQGKTFADAKGDVLRGLQVAETACGITTQITGEVLEVAKDMETRSYREPLGVVSAICPFSRCPHTYACLSLLICSIA